MAVQRQTFGPKQYVFPSDGKNAPIQVAPWSGQRASISFGVSSSRVALPTGSEVVELAATENCYIAFGDSTVDATTTIANDASRLFIAGVQTVLVPIDSGTDEPYTHIAAIRATVDGVLQVEKA